MRGLCPQEGSTGVVVTQPGDPAELQEAACSHTSDAGTTAAAGHKAEATEVQASKEPKGVVQPTVVATNDFAPESFGNGAVPSSQQILNAIASKYLQSINPSTPDEFNDFIQYMEKVRKVVIVDVKTGSLIVTVACSSLEIIDELWEDYRTGHLNEMAQKFLATEEILVEFGLAELKITTTINEEEYKACRELFLNPSSRYLDLIMNPKYTC